jgi:hypothetical protein
MYGTAAATGIKPRLVGVRRAAQLVQCSKLSHFPTWTMSAKSAEPPTVETRRLSESSRKLPSW